MSDCIDNTQTLSLSYNTFHSSEHKILTNPLPHRDTFNAFANRADPDLTALVIAGLLLDI